MMHPSTINNDFNGKTSNLSTTSSYYNHHHQRTTSCFSNFSNYNHHHENLSKPIPLELHQPPPAAAIVRGELFQQPPFTINDHNAVIIAGSNHYKTTTSITDDHMQSTMVKQSSYNINNGKFVAAYDNRVIMKENECSLLRGIRKKKDRHSKINTARGPRDRRMRLSLDVAKRFFRLQDILGFDKASNTIDWLLIKSKPAIQDLILPQHLQLQGLLLVSSSSPASSSSSAASDQGEVVSGRSIDDDQSMDKAAAIIDQDQVMLINNIKQAKFSSSSNCSRPSNNYKKKKRKISGVCNIVDHGLAKETREKARARARKRTSEKKNTSIKLAAADAAACFDEYYYSKLLIRPASSSLDQNINHDRIPGSWIPQVQATSADHHQAAVEYGSNNYFQFKSQAAAAGINNINVGTDHNSMISNYWSPSSLLFNYQHNNPAAAAAAEPPSHDEHDDQLSDFQILGKPWELGEFN